MSATTVVPVTRWWRHPSRADRLAVLGLVVAPALLFSVPALLGHPAIVADNLIQNFPLRVLAGRQIAGGHLPLFNPYADSGTPLLGGLNAGALYPGTLLFAVLPALVAWTINLIAVYVTAALGLYALARWYGLRALASFAGALSFAYLGAMMGQIVHLGVIQGFALLPWAVLVMVSLAARLRAVEVGASLRVLARAARTPLLGYVAIWALTFLSGEPRAYAELELLTMVVAPSVLVLRSSYWLTTWRARGVYALSLALGLFWGAAAAMVQLLPGWSFIGVSQRSEINYWFFGSGSLAVRWTPLLFVPDLFGGNGVLGTPSYFVTYNLPEVTGYAGVVALVASAAYLARLTRRGWVGQTRDYALYVVIGVVGLFATWGNFTPLGHLFRAIPYFGATRLQSRNVVLLDLVGAVLLAWWLDRLQASALEEASIRGPRRWFTLAPAGVVVAICAAMLVGGPWIVTHLGASPPGSQASHETLTLALHLVVALALVVVVLRWGRLRAAVRWLSAILALDVTVFLVFCATGLVSTGVSIEPSRAAAVATLGVEGRFGLVDHASDHYRQYVDLGTANSNVFTRLASVQGYGSLIASTYNASTGTHPMNSMNPCELRRGVFAQLRLSALAVSASQLATAVGQRIPAPAFCRTPPSGDATVRYFGQVLDVASVTLRAEGPGAPGASPTATLARGVVVVQALGATGLPVGAPHTLAPARAVRVDLGGVRAAALRVSGPHLALLDTVVRPTRGAPVQLDTPFQYALASPRWRLASTPGTFQVFRATHLSARAWLDPPAASSRVTRVRDAPWGDAWITVAAATPVTLVRSMAYLPGWRASAQNTRGVSRELVVRRHGLVQSVRVPAGTWTVHFHYHAPHIELGVALSSVASFLWLGVVAMLVTGRRRPRGTIRS